MGTGKGTEPINDYIGVWDYAIPDTVIEAILNSVCDKFN